MREIKAMAREFGVRVEGLLALGRRYDPFYVGSPADVRKAEWAGGVFEWVMEEWERYRELLRGRGFYVGDRPHLRGIHYLLMTGHPDPKRYDGEPYHGTHRDWESLLVCFVKGRILRKVPFGALEDRKHPEVVVNLVRGEDDEMDEVDAKLEETITADDVSFSISIPTHWLKVYQTPRKSIRKRIPVHLEIWSEKRRELIDQLAGRYFVNVQNSEGEQTYEPVYEMLKRAKEASRGRPIVVLYVSDYDPRGEMTMPVAVSRKIEWMLQNLDEFRDIPRVLLKKVMLTREQVEKLEIPPAPVKETEPMKGRWRTLKGEYVAEVDALVQLRPLEMVEILREEIERFIPSEVVEAIREYNKRVEEEVRRYNEEVDRAVSDAMRDTYDEVRGAINKALSEFEAEIEIDVSERFERLKEVIDGWEEPDWEIDWGDPDEWLFDSSRSYLEQMKYYRRIRGS